MRHIHIFFVFAVLFCGCGKKIVTVTGEVLYEGTPAKDIAVVFEPKSDGTLVSESGLGVTGADGRFTLESSSRKRGVELGAYTVHLGWKNPNPIADDTGGAGPPPDVEIPVPVSPYRFPEEQKEIVVNVQGSGKNHFVLKISPEAILCE